MNKDRENYEPYEDDAAAGLAGASGTEADFYDGEEAPEEQGEGSGIPLRGLAMVLVAVAILLAIWGVWALVGGDDKNDDSGADATTEATEVTAPAQQPAGQSPTGQAQPGQATQQPAVTGAPQTPATPAPAEANGVVGDSQPSTPAPAPSTPAENAREGQNQAQGDGQSQAQSGRVNVLNNSTVQDLAANTSRQLEGQGNQIGEVGNLPEEQYKVDETTVFYQPSAPGSEERARRLADQLGGVARPYDPNLPATTAGQGDLTVVLAGAVAAPTR
ncbi:LytR C-terminal domain-containing protein [Corynebacterium oculi]|uniref:LytR C-terminal domain-containing protein n=1 Tax=Corynebacterium oculi TaxID=1544416 RepID=UPI00123757E5|nr:LytR C-terminal domain-containing protein [Corynebacterium oculi]